MADKQYLYSEIFDSIQGEGQYTGVPTAWLRFFLCNLQCDGFGQDQPTKPEMCFTGGEPLMKTGQQCSMDMMKKWIDERDFPRGVTYETNGTKKIEAEGFIEFWNEYRDVWGSELFISCSPKLFNVSGEKTEKAIKPEIVETYLQFTNRGQLKFVVNGTDDCWKELEQTIEAFRDHHVEWPVWIMPVGATLEGQELVAADVATEAFKRGYNVSARVHTYLWGNAIGV